jgi:hypothetical protein
MPKDLPKGTETHMFGPDALLKGWTEGIGTYKGEK